MTHRLLTLLNRYPGQGAAPGPTVLILDEFTDADGTLLSAHTIAPTNTPGGSWVAALGSFSIDTNKARVTTNLVNSWALVESGVSDCKVSSVVRQTVGNNRDMFLVFRATDKDNCFYLAFYNGGFDLYTITAGAFVLRASDTPAMAAATDYTMLISGSGNTVTATLDGLYTLSYTSAHQNTATIHGINNSRVVIVFDDFKVTVP